MCPHNEFDENGFCKSCGQKRDGLETTGSLAFSAVDLDEIPSTVKQTLFQRVRNLLDAERQEVEELKILLDEMAETIQTLKEERDGVLIQNTLIKCKTIDTVIEKLTKYQEWRKR